MTQHAPQKRLARLLTETHCALGLVWWDLTDPYEQALVNQTLSTLRRYSSELKGGAEPQKPPRPQREPGSLVNLTARFSAGRLPHALGLVEQLERQYKVVLQDPSSHWLQPQANEFADISAALGTLFGAKLNTPLVETRDEPFQATAYPAGKRGRVPAG